MEFPGLLILGSATMCIKTCFAVAAIVIASSTAYGQAGGNPVFESLTTEGIELSDGSKVKTPEPSFADDLTAEQEQKILATVSGGQPVARFTRNSRVAPISLVLKSQENSKGERTGQTANLWFVAYGDLEIVAQKKLLENLFQLGESKTDARQLDEAELALRNITVLPETPTRQQRFSILDVDLLSKVQLDGVTQMFVTRTDGSLLAAFSIDARFNEDKSFPNTWRSITRNNLGKEVLGPPAPYKGFGGYVKATQLKSVPGALLIELHLAFNEPAGWFGGRNLLGSKLPLLMQDNARSFRSKLKAAEQ